MARKLALLSLLPLAQAHIFTPWSVSSKRGPVDDKWVDDTSKGGSLGVSDESDDIDMQEAGPFGMSDDTPKSGVMSNKWAYIMTQPSLQGVVGHGLEEVWVLYDYTVCTRCP